VQKLNENNSAAGLPDSPAVREWWDYMAPLMETHSDNSPIAEPLKEVSHLD
jgi:L-rhamnose mutarotase